MNQESESINQQTKPGRSSSPSSEPSETGDEGAFTGHAEQVTIDQLYNELRSNSPGSTEKDVRLTPEQHSEVILDQLLSGLFKGSGFTFEEATVKENLDEILLLLVAHRSSDTHGKSLMADIATIFDTRLSPGTVYPQLHELKDDELLAVQELVRTKEYRVDDEHELTERVTASMEQHLALGLFYQAALAELS